MTKGVLVFARNNSQIDYVKQAYYMATRVQKFLNIPVSIVTDNSDYLKKTFSDHESVFDKIIDTGFTDTYTLKRYNDGTLAGRQLEFKNDTRTLAYNLTPYDETLLLDSDFLVNNDVLNNCFSSNKDFLIYKDAYDLANFRDYSEFDYVSDTSVPFYWERVYFLEKLYLIKSFLICYNTYNKIGFITIAFFK